jgi:DNA-binding CsgD family transcriptional regulator
VAPTHLTARETEIRDLAAERLTNEEIAARLGLSKRTVEAHLRMVYRKTGVSGRGDLDAGVPREATPVARGRVQELERRLAMRERQLQSYEDAMRRIIDRQFPLYDEKVEITVKVGSNRLEDVVTEKHWTDPNPYLVYRVVRPITAAGAQLEDPVETLAITCEVDRADVGVAVQAVADVNNRPRALILFQPGLDRSAEWTLRYRTPGLWDPLRRDGVDELTWAAGTLDRRYADGINDLRVRFQFPAAAEDVEVSERRGAGRIERRGATEVVYSDESRTGGLYVWELRMRPTAEPHSADEP